MNERRTQRDARALTEGALLAAVTIILYLVDFYTQLLVYVIPVPVAIIVVRNNVRTGALATVVAALGVGLILGPIQGAIVLVSVGLVGLTLGICLSRGTSWIVTIGFTALAATAMIVTDFLLGAVVANVSPAASLALIQKSLVEAGAQAAALYSKLGIPEASIDAAKRLFDLLPIMFSTFLPIIVVGGSIMAAAIAYAVSRWVLLRMGKTVEPIPPFQYWKVAWHWVWGLIAGMLLTYAGGLWSIPWLTTLGQNVTSGFVLLYTVQGVAVLWWLLTKWNMAKFLKFLMVFFVYSSPALNIMLPLAGLVEGWFGFRQRESVPRGGA